MSMTFTKLFSSITASTIWAAPDHTRIVWITMLAMADQHGRVWASIPGLANIARVPIEATESALEELMSPDKYSRTKDNDGRRIEEIDGGWRLLNHAKYRAIRDEESIKQSKRAYINKRRAEERASKSVEQCRTESIAVDRGRANTEAEAEAEANTDTRSLVDLDNQQDQEPSEGTPTTPTAALAEVKPRKEKPIISGKAITIHRWMFEECEKTLGSLAAEFDVLDWLWKLDEYAWRENLVIPKRDSGAWLQAELVAEAQRRGLPLRFATVSKQSSWEQEIWAKRRMGL